MATKLLIVRGMHCASCAAIISKKASNISGVSGVSVNFANETAQIAYEHELPLDKINAAIEPLGYSLADDMHEHHHGAASEKELRQLQRKVRLSVPVAGAVFVLMLWDMLSRATGAIPELPIPMELFTAVSLALATVFLFWIGQPFLRGVWHFIRHGAANMDTLIGIGTLTAYLYSLTVTMLPSVRSLLGVSGYTYFDVTIVVIGFITLGKYLEATSKKHTGDAIKALLTLQAKTALVIRNGVETEIPIAEVVHGDRIIVKPAGKIPVDGIIAEGSSYVDESMVTGEPVPVLKQAGDSIIAGTLNTTGSFTFTATKVGSETVLAHIIRMVQEAQGSRAPIQALADRISAIFVPIVLIISALSLALWLLIGSHAIGFSQSLSLGILSFVSVLVIACPCALGLATPTAIIVGVGKGAKAGILIKDAATLEKLHAVDVVVVDKTGTITIGKPELVAINTHGGSESDALAILAALEKKSEHPIAHAIVAAAQERKLAQPEVSGFEIIKGEGLHGTIDGTEYFAGNARLMERLQLHVDTAAIDRETMEGKTPVLLARKDTLVATVFVADAIKPEAVAAVRALHDKKIKVVMLTGDNQHTAEYIAKQAGIDTVIAQVTPADKLAAVKNLQEKGHIVAMAGDGVNDAPALAQADVGIAMATGTDVAIESAGITLLHGDIAKLVKAINLSRLTMRGIKQNLFWAFIYNIVGIPLAAGLFYPIFGWLLNPIFAGLAMAFSSVSVVGNSLRLKTKQI